MGDFNPTPEQQRILDHDSERHARILAGPGTGKSATLVALVDKLLSGFDSPSLRLLTFTRAATGELAKKVSDYPAAAAARPSTIHSFAISVLVRNPGATYIPEPLRIADTWEYKNIVRRTLARRVGVGPEWLDKLVREMAAGWESLTPKDDPAIDPGERARFHGAWDEHRRVYGYTLLDELPYALRDALRNHPDLEGVEYDLLIVDEYQDLNACDLEVISLMRDRGCRVIGAGDDDQSIYFFRNAAPAGIRRFLSDYPRAADYPLSVTQRCGARIIEWARHVIEPDPARPPKGPLVPAAGSPPGEVALLAFGGHVAEAKGIARLIEKLVEVEGVAVADILVLLRSDYRGNFSGPIKDELARLGIPYSDADAVDVILAEPDNRRLLATFRLLTNRTDSLAWASLLRITSGITDEFASYIYDRARAANRGFGERLLSAYEDGFPGAPSGSSRAARSLIESTEAWLEVHSVPTDREGLWGQWMIELSGDPVVPNPSAKLTELLLALDELAESNQDLGRYLGSVRPLARDRAFAESPGVRIMTMTSAKGLTVRATIIAALEDGILPRPEADLSEERRLLYVAMTRSREFVYATWARRRRGPTARSGAPRLTRRAYCNFLRGGPVETSDGDAYIRERWPE